MAMTAAERQAARRARLRVDRLRPVQLWVPDTRDPQLAKRIRNQCRALAADPHEGEIMDWVEAATGEIEDWE
jgi:hypothetical protein